MLRILLFGLWWVCCGCTLTAEAAPSATPVSQIAAPTPEPGPPTWTPSPALPTPDPSPTLQPAWTPLAPGLDLRLLNPDGNPLAQVAVLRIDPARYTFRAHHTPGSARFVEEWQAALPDAAALVNANYFHSDYTVLGLLVSGGMVYGATYTDRGGTFAVIDGVPRLWSNLAEPYGGQALQEAVQGFPMLVAGGEAAFTRSSMLSRRTAIAIDVNGHILLLATTLLGMSLEDFSAFLAEAELDIVTAMNLDGGGSTMMAAAGEVMVTSFDAVPAVLAIYPLPGDPALPNDNLLPGSVPLPGSAQ